MNVSLKDLAIAYAQWGWSVFPLEPRGKRPLGLLAPHGLHDATTDEETIRGWWAAVPEANIGIRTGELFDALDLDDEDAMTRFTAMVQEHGLDPRVFPRSRTGRGGRHILLAATGLGNRAGIVPGMDWRGRGGYIVAPGSIHPDTGAAYEWIAAPNGSFPPAPDWLLELLRPARQDSAPAPPAAANDERPPEVYLRRALEAEVTALRTTPEGQRNDQLNRSAFALGQLVGAGWLQHHLAEAELRAAAYAVGLSEPEVSRTIRSGLESGREDPRQVPAGGWSQTEAGGVIRHGLREPTTEELSGFDALVEPGPEWAARAHEQVSALVRGVLVAGGLGFLISDPKAGKTWLAMELAISIVSGQPLLHRYPVERTGRVLYVATEGRRDGALARLRSLALGHGIDPNHVLQGMDFLWRRGVRLDDKTFVGWLTERSSDYALIIVDVLVDAWDGDENKADQVSRLLRGLRPVTDAGATVLLLHHLSKGAPDGGQSLWQRLRGSTAFRGAYDSGIGLERSASSSRTKVSLEHRDDAPVSPFTFSWPEELVTGEEAASLDWQLVDSDLGAHQEAEAKVLAAAQRSPGLSQSALARQVGGNYRTTVEAIQGLAASGHLVRRTVRGVRANGRSIVFEGLFNLDPSAGSSLDLVGSRLDPRAGPAEGATNLDPSPGGDGVPLPPAEGSRLVAPSTSGADVPPGSGSRISVASAPEPSPCRWDGKPLPGCQVHMRLLDAKGRCPQTGQLVRGETS